jgi:hypothetical protein
MKLGVAYMFFNGEEHLYHSVKSIRNQVDYIVVIFQCASNFGKLATTEAISIVSKLKKEKLIDNLLIYKPDFSKDGYENNLLAREHGLQDCLNHQCTHFLPMDSDEYYKEEELKFAKDKIEQHNFDATACPIYCYYKVPTLRLKEVEQGYYVPLIYKINKDSKFIQGGEFPVYVDPIRIMNFNSFYLFNKDEIAMHHMSFVRKNWKSKVENHCTYQYYYTKGTNERKRWVDSLTTGVNRPLEEIKKTMQLSKEQHWESMGVDLLEVSNIFNIEGFDK